VLNMFFVVSGARVWSVEDFEADLDCLRWSAFGYFSAVLLESIEVLVAALLTREVEYVVFFVLRHVRSKFGFFLRSESGYNARRVCARDKHAARGRTCGWWHGDFGHERTVNIPYLILYPRRKIAEGPDVVIVVDFRTAAKNRGDAILAQTMNELGEFESADHVGAGGSEKIILRLCPDHVRNAKITS